jgi:hypothetical protein
MQPLAIAPPSTLASTWRRVLLAICLAALATLLVAPDAVTAGPAADGGAPPPALPGHVAGYRVATPFLRWLETHGGADRVGAPISHPLVEDDITTQYFRFGRLELAAGERVELTALGRLVAGELLQTAPFAWVGAEAPEARDPERVYLAEAGHTLGGAFRWYWQANGAVPLLGYPISEEFFAPDAAGVTRRVQYFERAVLIYEPQAAPDAAVQRLPLGAWYADQRAIPAAARIPSAPPALLAMATLPFNPASGDGQNIALAAARLNGATIEAGKVLSFLTAIGGISEKNGYQTGRGIQNGVLTDMAGGGVCLVSTALYRAAWDAGLPVSARTGHRFWLSAFAGDPGLEAAVADPGLDLQIGNNLAAPVLVEATTTNGLLILRLWGESDGRRVTRAPAKVQTPNGNPQRDGATVTTTRTIEGGPWPTPRVERVITRYQPLPTTAPADPPSRSGGTPS